MALSQRMVDFRQVAVTRKKYIKKGGSPPLTKFKGVLYCLRDGRGWKRIPFTLTLALRNEDADARADHYLKRRMDYESESDLVVASVWARRASFGADRETVARFEQEGCGVERRCNYLPQSMQKFATDNIAENCVEQGGRSKFSTARQCFLMFSSIWLPLWGKLSWEWNAVNQRTDE